ncbi:MAG: 2Fe-2S iron-sulfur cluster-binding protein, partial [Candidatus Omnitrophota bacterium]
MKYKVIFQPFGRGGEIEEGKTLQQAASELGVEIESICGEKKTCGKCKVQIQEGFFEKFGIDSKMENLSKLTEEEKNKLKPKEIKSNYRLSCTAEINGEILVFVPEESRGGGQVIRKAATDLEIEIDPAIRKYYVEMNKATLEDPGGDLERLLKEIERTHKLKNLPIDYEALKTLPDVMREGDWKVTVSVWQDKEIIRVEPGLKDKK